MKKRNSAPLAVDVDVDREQEEVTDQFVSLGGTLTVRDFRLNALGGLGQEAGIPLSELNLKKELGRGASSIVYFATYKPTAAEWQYLADSQVAVKCLTSLEAGDLPKQLVAELNFLRPKLRADRSVHVVQLFDAYHHDGKTYIVMEFCERGSLSSCIEKFGPPPEEVLSVIMRHIFLGLAFLHRNSIIHRDMKPSNCLVTSKGVVKVSDFGSSRQAGTVGCASTFTGTMQYMSPERLDGDTYSAAADIWSAGMIMLELAHGHHPYKLLGSESTFVAMFDYAKHGDTPPLPAGYSSESRHLVEACLAKRPAGRPSAAAVAGRESLGADGAAGGASVGGGMHPFIEKYLHLAGQDVVEWSGGRSQYE